VCVLEHIGLIYRGADKSLARPTFNCFFQSREQVVVRRGQIRRIGWVISYIGIAGRLASSGLQVPG
jgi:hypothetical protein